MILKHGDEDEESRGVVGQNLFPRADNALPEGRGIARPNSPSTRFFHQNFLLQNNEISFFSPEASMESLEAGKKPMLDNHPMF